MSSRALPQANNQRAPLFVPDSLRRLLSERIPGKDRYSEETRALNKKIPNSVKDFSPCHIITHRDFYPVVLSEVAGMNRMSAVGRGLPITAAEFQTLKD
jgi:hypothetical protein